MCKFQKIVHSLKQALRAENKKLNHMLVKKGFMQAKTDPCLKTTDGYTSLFMAICLLKDQLRIP